MIYRIVATVLLLVALGAAVVLTGGESRPSAVSEQAPAGPDDSTMKSLRIE